MLIWTKTKFAHVRRHDRTFKKQSCVQCLHSDEQNHFELFFATNDLAAIMNDCLHFWPCPFLHGSDFSRQNQILRAKEVAMACAHLKCCCSHSPEPSSSSSQCCEGCAPSGETELKHATLEEETAQPSADEDASDSGSGDALLSDLGNLSSEEH